MTIEEARKKAEEMKAKAAAKRAAKEAAAAQEGAAAAPAKPHADNEKFVLGDHNLILIDWDDTLFPTSAWKDRIKEGSTHPPRPSKVQALCESISGLITTLQKRGEVKIVTHGTKSWYEHSSSILNQETKALLDKLDHRYRDSHGDKYMRKRPAGEKYTCEIGVQVDNYGEWFKTDMFFRFISEKKTLRKWDEAHMPEKVILPRQVLIIGDGNAEKRSYDEHGNQARIYASRPGHEAVANVGLKGLFYKDGPSYEELVVQQKWSTSMIESTFLPADDFRTCMWDLTCFPQWLCSLKAGANAYTPISNGAIDFNVVRPPRPPPPAVPMATNDDDDEALQMALAMSMSQQQGADGDVNMAAEPPVVPPTAELTAEEKEAAEEERQMQEAMALSLS